MAKVATFWEISLTEFTILRYSMLSKCNFTILHSIFAALFL